MVLVIEMRQMGRGSIDHKGGVWERVFAGTAQGIVLITNIANGSA